MMYRIVSTDFDGNVRVTCPAPEIHAVMTRGGGWFDHNERSIERAMKYELDKQVNNGRNPSVTKRHVHALAFGGLTDAEFFELIRDRDVHVWGTGGELWHVNDVPKDRWFRNAWTRSLNGGPINVDLEKARPIQAQHIDSAYASLKKPNGVLGRLTKQQIFDLDEEYISTQIKEAATIDQLRAVWPEGLNVRH